MYRSVLYCPEPLVDPPARPYHCSNPNCDYTSTDDEDFEWVEDYLGYTKPLCASCAEAEWEEQEETRDDDPREPEVPCD